MKNKILVLEDYCVESGIYGIPAIGEEYDEKKYRYLRITDITDDGVLLNTDLKSVSDKDASKYLLSENDIVIARTGNSTGRTYFYDSRDGVLVFAGFLIKYKLDANKINPKYLKYFTLSKQYKHWVANFSTGSTRGNMSAVDFAQMPLIVPERKQQDLLVKVLDLITDKISLNNRINTELESMAKTIYDYWFLQFDFPDEESKPYKTSGGEMEYNEDLKKEIPVDWGAGTFNDFAEIVGGSTPSTLVEDNFSTNGTAWITPKDLAINETKKFITKGEIGVSENGLKSASLNIMPKGTILMSSRAPIGYMAISRGDVTTNQGFKSFIPREDYFTAFIFYTVKSYIPTFIKKASGSTFKEVAADTVKEVLIFSPPKSLIKIFSENLTPIFEKQNVLELENQELITIRNFLLPLLMNGQVKVK